MKNLFSAPDNVNKKTVIFFIGMLIFWYPTLVISGLTDDRFFFLSNVLLNSIGTVSRPAAICVLALALLALAYCTFYKKRAHLLHIVMWVDVALAMVTREFTDFEITRRFGLGYYYVFFYHVIPGGILDKLLLLYSEEAIGRMASFILVIGCLLLMVLGDSVSKNSKEE